MRHVIAVLLTAFTFLPMLNAEEIRPPVARPRIVLPAPLPPSTAAVAPAPRVSTRGALFVAPTTWTSQGPTFIGGGQVEGNVGSTILTQGSPVAGAVQPLAPHPVSANILYCGGVNGGIWKTMNATASSPAWTPLTDHFPLSMGSMAFDLDPADTGHNTLVAGIARRSNDGSIHCPQRGVLRTIDGGAHWTLLGNNAVGVNGGLLGEGVISIIAKGATIIAGAEPDGAFLSTDTGATWNNVSDGALGHLPSGSVTDLRADSNLIFYAAVTGANGGVFSSPDGSTWTNIDDGGHTLNTFFAAQTPVNVKLAITSPTNIAVAVVSSTSQLSGVFRTTNGGTNWAPLLGSATASLPSTGPNKSGIHPGAQGFVNFAFTSDSSGNLYISGDRQPDAFEDGNSLSNGNLQFPNASDANDYSARAFKFDGASWTSLTHSGTADGSSPHADSRQLAFDAGGDLLMSCDGGVYRRTSPTITNGSAGSWSSVNGNLDLVETRLSALDSVSGVIIASTQDNGTQFQTGSTTWTVANGGDGGVVAVDDSAATTSTRYISFPQLDGLERSTYDKNGNQTSQTLPGLLLGGIDVRTTDSTFRFETPFKLNVNTPTSIVFGSNNLYESTDQGETLTQVGGFNDYVFGLAYGGMHLGAPTPGSLWVISLFQQVYFRASGALGTAVPPTPSQPPATGHFTGLAVDPADNTHAFICTDTCEVFMTTDAGVSWTNITGNLPLATANIPNLICITAVNTGSLSFVMVGGFGDTGTNGPVFAAGASDFTQWTPLGSGLPDFLIADDLQYNARADELLLASVGRGTYTIANASTYFADSAAKPAITSLSPDSAQAGGAAFTLTVNGKNFLPNSVVQFGGNAKTTTFVSSTKLTAAIAQTDVLAAGNVNVTVMTPSVGTSAAATFFVTPPTIPPLITSATTATATAGTAFSYTITATGSAPITFNATNLPPGLSFAVDTISGTPTQSGQISIALSATNGNGSASAALKLTISPTGGAAASGDRPPKFTSNATAMPNPAVTGDVVTFTAATSDPDGDLVDISWDFGDGTTGDGASVTHTYTTAGLFTVKATASDGISSVNDIVRVGVSVQSAPSPLTISKSMLKFDFKHDKNDSLTMSGTLTLPINFAPTGKVVNLLFGDSQHQFMLDKTGKGGTAFKLQGKLKNGIFTSTSAKYSLNVKKAALFEDASSLGFSSTTVPKPGDSIDVPVLLQLDTLFYGKTATYHYTAKSGVSGMGKAP